MSNTFGFGGNPSLPVRRVNITVAGLGYVGTSLAALLAKHHNVKCYDIASRPIQYINQRLSPVKDADIDARLSEPDICLQGFMDPSCAFSGAEYIIIATPTNYSDLNNTFDTASVEDAIRHSCKYAPNATVVIKSTVPVGYTDSIRREFPTCDLIFSPEFLREGRALYDNLFPARIVVGNTSANSGHFAEVLRDSSNNPMAPIFICGNREAESIKLFSNTYLAMRVAFFNELDTFAYCHGLTSQSIIDAIALDNRIGSGYNNPSFGYGGYCLPKDTKQLLSNYDSIPQSLIAAIVEANNKRKLFISDVILRTGAKRIGVYRLSMKAGSDNFRESSVLDIVRILRNNGKDILIFEPMLNEDTFDGMNVTSDISIFKSEADLIIANRMSLELQDVRDRVFSRYIFGEN